MCNRPNGQDGFRRISCYPNVLAVLFCFDFENNATQFCNSNLSFSARKRSATNGRPPPLIGTPVYGSPTCHMFSNDGQLSLLETSSNWRFGILVGLPSNRGHHSTLRVWAPLSYTGGLKGFGWRAQNFIRLSQLTFTVARLETQRGNENTSEPQPKFYVTGAYY